MNDIVKKEESALETAISVRIPSYQEKWEMFVDKIQTTGSIETAKNLSMLSDDDLYRICNQFPDVALVLKQLKFKFKERIIGNLARESDKGNVNASIYLLEKHFKESEDKEDEESDIMYVAKKWLKDGSNT